MSDPVGTDIHPHLKPAAGRGAAITAMALGLAALVTVLVAVFYLPLMLIVGAGLAIAAVVFGGIAIAKRGPRAPGITGLTAGALALALAVSTVAFGAGTLGLHALMGLASQASMGNMGNMGGKTDANTDDPASANVEWPANFATGGIMFTGGKDGEMRVIESEPLPDNSFPDVSELPAGPDGVAPNRIQVYLDYRCPACLTFESANGDTLERAARAGAVVELQPLTFLDSASAGTYYSSRVSGAMACVAEHQPTAAWSAHVALLSPEFQPEGGTEGPDNAAVIDRIEGAAGALNGAARRCITEEQHVIFAQALSNWISTNPVPRSETSDLRVAGTPLVLADGVAFTGDISDPGAFTQFLEQQGVPLG
ncbi:DsbA family protein [Leucobacter sp. HY1910]